MPLILPGNVASATAGAYSIENSFWANGTSQGLVRTQPSDDPTLGTKSTVSFWAKRSLPNSTGTNQFYSYTNGGSSPYNQMYWPSNGRFQWQNHDGTTNTSIITNQQFKDPAAWYHMVFSYDSTPSTPDASSVKMFVNGVQVTDFYETPTYPSQNVVSQVCKPGVNFPICYYPSTAWYSGYYAEVMVVDGQALNADSFGEFDSDSPTIWKPIDISGIDVGNLGSYLEFKNSAELGTDTSGVGDFTETALTALNQSTDTPTNNFCVMNPLDNYYAGATFSLGHTKVVTNAGNKTWVTGTVGLSAGKWYWEIYNVTSPSDYVLNGIAEGPTVSSSAQLGAQTYNYAHNADNGTIYNAATGYAYGVVMAVDEILGVYLDLDNNKLYFAKDGVIMNSGTGHTISAASLTANGLYFPAVGEYSTSTYTASVNFGGSSHLAISSGNADANGYGNFEFSPNDGGGSSFDSAAKDFLAICTKNLGSDGG